MGLAAREGVTMEKQWVRLGFDEGPDEYEEIESDGTDVEGAVEHLVDSLGASDFEVVEYPSLEWVKAQIREQRLMAQSHERQVKRFSELAREITHFG